MGKIHFRVLDLFCGAGGFSSGIDQNPYFETLLALDFEQSAINTFSHNFPKAQVICGDITDIKIKNTLIKQAKRLKVNMIIGGPPCQGFSLKGKKLGLQDPRNFLFLEYLDIVKQLQPELFIIENVKSIFSTANGYFKNEIERHIQDLGYKVDSAILNAKDFCVPQNRERAFFIAHKKEYLGFPAPSEMQVCVKDAISDLAYLQSNQGEITSPYKNPPQSAYQKMLRGEILQYHKASNHSQIAIKKLEMIPKEKGKEYLPKNLHGKQKFNTTWGRLKWNEISPTIDTRFDTPSNGTNSHPFLHRSITPREAARIQSFSDSFIFLGKKTQVCKQIGNAVPPLLAKALADHIASELL
ncbi:DNA (cytosine-5-)-methyltransferase [Helicobacter winghamensis ATCC BAA-430]|nr:DNA (cytosine-5-)-methyltransferase [Helicobacter winghamensis ATCC BAA-430]